MPPTDPLTPRPLGLRERKKAQTRAAIQRHALRLFREQGYGATTMEQVAEVADVSPSTLYRYFATKEDLVLTDDYDPLLAAAFRAQPPHVPLMEALRVAVRSVLSALPADLRAEMRERTELTLSIPEVRARALDNFTPTMELLAELFAERSGVPLGDFSVRILSGTVIGAMLAAQFHWVDHPEEDIVEVIDRAMVVLIEGPDRLGSRG